jgi:TATA element modulatory factor
LNNFFFFKSVRSDISRLEHQHSLREDMLRKEIADLQQQLRDTEMRNNELSQNISSATRPLLRQIENLQSSHSNQIELLENAERNLIERLKESQANCCDLTEKNRYNKEQLIEMQQQIKTYEAQMNTLKTEKSKINAEYQMVKTSLETYENEKFEKEAQQKLMISSLQQQIERLTKEKKSLEAQLDMEKIKVENESKRLQTLMNDLAKERELQREQQLKLMNSSSSSIDSLSSTPTNASTPTNTKSFSFLQRVSSNQSNENNNSRYDLIQSMQSGGAFSILESLQSKLKQKDGEINQLQVSYLTDIRWKLKKN